VRRVNAAALEGLSPAERKEAEKLLAELQAKYEANPLLRYEPHEKQKEFHRARTYIKAFLGGNRSGKTTAGIVDDLIQAVDEDCLPDNLRPYKKFQPPFHCRIVCPSEKIMESIVFQKLREWTPKDQYVGGEWGKAFSKSQRILTFKNGSYFDFLTYEQDVDKHGGAAKHRIHYDEVPPQDIWNEGKMRLADYEGADAIFTMTPLDGLNWAYDELWVPWEKKKLKDGFIVTVDIDDNPYLSPNQRDKALEGYSQAELQARKKGRFVHFAGMIYPEFDRNQHVIPETPIPEGAYVYCGIDPGMRVMAAVIWVYVETSGRIVVFDELGIQGETVEGVAKRIHLINAKHGTKPDPQTEGQALPIKPRAYVIDPSARNIEHITGRSVQREYVDHGIYTVLAQNNVPAGINRVKERIENGKLVIMANCQGLIDEFRKYRWKTPGRSEDDPKEKPVKQDDHLLDALRYVVMHRPYGPELITEPEESQLQRLLKEDRDGLSRQSLARVQGIPI
jgi:phage terminase large subunit-like protein